MNNQTVLDLSHVPKELKALLELVKTDNHEFLRKNSHKLFSNLDWSLFFELALHHRIYPLLISKMKVLGHSIIPEEIGQALQQKYRQNTFRMLQLSAEMDYLSRIFSGNNIRLLILKGPVLSSDLYGDLSLRTCGDLDMMVPIEAVERVDSLLSEQGYLKDDYIETILGDWKWRHHHVTYFHSQKPIKVEIHWRLNPGPGFEPGFEELWQRKRECTFASSPVYYLGREDLFLFLVSHGARHGWSRLRWLLDIDRILKQNLDWVNLKQLMEKHHLLHLGGQAILLSSQMLNSPINKQAESFMKGARPAKLAQEAVFYFERMINLHTHPVPEDVSVYHKKHLFSLMSLQQKILFIMSFLFPYPEDAQTLPLPKRLSFLYFPLRPILWTWRKFVKLNMRKRRFS